MSRTTTRSLLSISITSLIAMTMLVAITPAASAQHPALDPVREVVDPVLWDVHDLRNEYVWYPAKENVSAAMEEHGPEMFGCEKVRIPFYGGIQACYATNWEDCSIMVQLVYLVCY